MRPLKPKVGLTVLYNPYEEGAGGAPNLLSTTKEVLEKLGLNVISSGEVSDEKAATEAGEIFNKEGVDVICLPLATWSDDYLVLDILERKDAPVIVWTFHGINTGSLCGGHQICSVLTELRKNYKFVYGFGQESQRRILSYSRAVALRNVLRRSLIGLIGFRIGGMTEVSFDEYSLKSVLGPRVIHFDVDELKELVNRLSDKDVTYLREKLKREVKIESNDEDVSYSLKMYLALKGLVKKSNVRALAVKCYPRLMGEVCLAYSLLADEGIVGACEGDVNSAVVMLMLHLLTGQPVHNTDLLAIYEGDNSAVFSHCGSGSFSLAERKDDVVLAPVRLAHKGVCVLFPSKPGNVTAVNLVGREGTYRMCIIAGEAMSTGMIFPGNPIKVKIPINVNEFIDMVAEEGFGHHWMIGYGDVRNELTDFCSLTGIKAKVIPEAET